MTPDGIIRTLRHPKLTRPQDGYSNTMNSFSVATFNVRGIRDRKKRRTIFRHLHVKYPNHVVTLQETHSSVDVEAAWQSEWGSTIIFTHGTAHQAGVAILLPRTFRGDIHDKHMDAGGRIAGVRLEIDKRKIVVLGIYAPAIDIQDEKIAFLEDLRNVIANFNEALMVIGGDFNIHLSPYDAEEGKFRETLASTKLREIVDEYFLVDVWREKNPRIRNFTWRRAHPLQQSRLDYIFVTANFRLEFEISAEISAGIRSDHSVVEVKAVPRGIRRGPGLWKYNNELHESDQIFVDAVRAEIAKVQNGELPYTADARIGVKVEMLLSNIRVISMRRGKAIAFQLREEEFALLEQVTAMEADLSTLDEVQKTTYMQGKERLDEIQTKRGKQAIIASGVRWIEQGERPTRYFLNRGKQLASQKTITEINDNGHMITGDQPILRYCADHYSKIFSAEGVNEEKMLRFLNSNDIPKLSAVEKQICEGLIENSECKFALSMMNKNKAPGITGFTAEFFLHFWNDIGDIITTYINDAYTNGFFITQKRGIITLIPKKGDQTSLQNKRPICLLDIIYKIVAKVMAIRLGKVINNLISPEQTGFIKGRYIGENLRLLSDVIDYCNLDKIGGLVMACDYRAAFDSIEHDFIFAALQTYNFGDGFIQWVKLLYGDAQLAITNNGYTSEWFQCNRGTFQGSPLSGMLFELAIEILAINVRASEDVRGISISNEEVKLSLYADDITAFLRDQDSAVAFIQIMDDFREASGLALNTNKSSVMWLGTEKHRVDAVAGIRATRTIKSLGIFFSANESCVAKNVNPIRKKIENVIDIWSQRSLTLKGRITVSKSLIVSQLAYLCACVKVPKHDITAIQSKIMRFLWRGRPPKVAKRILCQSIENGGLNAIDLVAFCSGLRLAWARRINICKESPWRRLLQARIGKYKLDDLLQTCLGKDDIKRFRIPVFYKDLLLDMQTYTYRPMEKKRDIQRESLWYNRSIRSAGKTLFNSRLYRAGIQLVNDLTNENGRILSLGELKNKIPGVRIDFLTYQKIIRAIPQMWKDRLSIGSYRKIIEQRDRLFNFHIGEKVVKLREMRSYHFYQAQIGQETPSAVTRWEHYGRSMASWDKVFRVPYTCTKSTKLQTLQYRILHRYLPTRRYLFIRNVTESPECRQCEQMDTIEHFLFECGILRPLWNAIFMKLNLTNVNMIETVIFGALGKKSAINLLIILVKQYIVQCKLAITTSTPTIHGLTPFINYHIDIERRAAVINDNEEKFRQKWSTLLDRDGVFTM